MQQTSCSTIKYFIFFTSRYLNFAIWFNLIVTLIPTQHNKSWVLPDQLQMSVHVLSQATEQTHSASLQQDYLVSL